MGNNYDEEIKVKYSGLYSFSCNQRRISINKLALMSNVKQSTIDNIIQGNSKNPTAKTLHKIATAFNMTLSEFLDFEELNNYSFEEDENEE